MKPLRKLFLLLAWLAVLPAAFVSAADAPVVPRPWPQDKSDIKPDPAAIYGTLPNGFRYIILPNKEPPGRVSLRLRVAAGSLMESEVQQGLAHFMEHMAFNGSKHFPPGEMVNVFQLLGMGFGADTNANTGFDRTLFLLDLPDTIDKTLRESLQLFQDDTEGLLLLQTEIDRERGVILSEKRDRDNVDYRTFVASWNFYFPDALIARRQPIGQESIIKESQRDRFADFYDKWYTPSRMTFIAVGDVKPADLLPLIQEYFGSIPTRADAPNPDLGKFGSPGFEASFHKEAEAPATTIQLVSIAPFDLGPDRVARRTQDLQLMAANFIISRRLERIARQPNAPILEAQAGADTSFDAFEMAEMAANCQPAQWQAAVNVVEQELRRALDFGFDASEVEEARANYINALEEAVKAAPTRKSRGLATEIAGSLDDNEVYTSPEQDLALLKPVLESLTPAQCQEALRQAWSRSGRRLYVSGNLDLPDADKTVTEVYNKSVATTIEKPTQIGAEKFAYESTGTPGQVADRHEVADLGITQLRFANNVRVNLKKTDFEANKVHVLVQFGGGKLDLTAKQPALALAAENIFIEGGLGKHSAQDLQRLLAGKNAGADFSVGDDFFELGGVTSGRDLRLELELLKAYLTDPGYRPEAYALARRGLPVLYNSLRQDVGGVFNNEVMRFLASDDFRFGYPTEEQANAVTMDDIRAWLASPLKDSYLEMSIVGDFDPAATEAALAATFGTLPSRAEKRADYSSVLNVKFPTEAKDAEKIYHVPTVIPKGIAAVVWPTVDESDIDRVRELGLLAEIFSDRLRVEVRQKLGQAYSPEVENVSSDVYPGYGFAVSYISADPKMAGDLADQARTIGDDLARNGVTQDEFDRAAIPLRKTIVEYRRQNSYWLGRVLGGSQAFPIRLERARTLAEAYDKITPSQVTDLAREYFGEERAVRILVLPEAPAAAPAPAPKPTP